MHTEWTDRLSEYLDGGLSPEEAARVEEHLGACDECAGVLEGLRAVVLRAQSLDTRMPERDLWLGIQEGIGAPADHSKVIDLSTRRASAEAVERRRTVRMSVPQLAAAALVLVFASGATAWVIRPDAQGTGQALATAETPSLPVAAVSNAPVESADDSQAGELAELEELLATQRQALSPNTIRILEKNLAAIDRAINESLQALASDPGNEFLTGHLEQARRRKLEYLRDASVAFQWST